MALRVGTSALLSVGCRSAMKHVTRTVASAAVTRTDGKRLFTPGPLNVSLTTKEAMLRDVGSRETDFVQLIQDLRDGLIQLAGVEKGDFACVPLQGSGTFALEAVLSTTVPRTGGKVLILENGAYGKRQIAICETLGIAYHHESFGECAEVNPERVAEILSNDKSFTHVSIVHCETSTGIFNNIQQIGEIVRNHAPGAAYFVDAMSTFGAVPLNMATAQIDYLVSSANKCIQGVPGFSFAICRLNHFMKCKGFARSLSLDLVGQYEVLEGTGQFRFTPPTHAMLAFGQAMRELQAEGGVEGRSARYQENHNCLRRGMTEMGFVEFLPRSIAGYIIATYLYPQDPNFDFKTFYSKLYEKGLVIYPGKLSKTDCFRLGNIGDLHKADMEHLVETIRDVCGEMGVRLPVTSS